MTDQTAFDHLSGKTVNALFAEAALRYPTRQAIVSDGAALTYAELDAKVQSLAAYLQNDLGIGPGDRVAVMMPNIMAFPVVLFAILRCGATQVNVNPMYRPRELRHLLNDAGVGTIITYTAATQTLAEVLNDVTIPNVLIAEKSDAGGPDLPSPAPADIANATLLKDALAEGENSVFLPVEVIPSDPIFLQYTGGTTGLSKGAVLTHSNLVENTRQFRTHCGGTLVDGEEVFVTALPLYHVFALMVNMIASSQMGATNHLVSDPRNIRGLIDTLRAANPTFFTGVNTLYNALTSHPRAEGLTLPRLKVSMGGGATIERETSARWHALIGQHICEGYGLSETSPVLTMNYTGGESFSYTAGAVLPDTEILILDDAGAELPKGETGEICCKGPQVLTRYWNTPEPRETFFTPDGFFRTGDLGYFTEGGLVRIVDRKKDMVIVSAFNVYPSEVETVIMELDGVTDCACIGVPDEKTGEAVKLFVVVAQGGPERAEILAQCRAHLAAYKVPKHIEFVDSIPRSELGKLLRRKLRD